MRVFVDTSAVYALLDQDDANHQRAAAWQSGPGRDLDVDLVTHSYVIVECDALVSSRFGFPAVRLLFDEVLPALEVLYISDRIHERAVAAYLGARRRHPSFVDRVSFEFMREGGIEKAFAFDRDFLTEGFRFVK